MSEYVGDAPAKTMLEAIEERDAEAASRKTDKYIFRCYADLHEYESPDPLPDCGSFCPGCKGTSPRPLLQDITPSQELTQEEQDRAWLLRLAEYADHEISCAAKDDLPYVQKCTCGLTALLLEQEK